MSIHCSSKIPIRKREKQYKKWKNDRIKGKHSVRSAELIVNSDESDDDTSEMIFSRSQVSPVKTQK